MLTLTLLLACSGETVAVGGGGSVGVDEPAPADDTDDVDGIVGFTNGFVPHALRRDGDRLLVAGEQAGDMALLALDLDLQPITSFGDGGRVLIDMGGDPSGIFPHDVDAAWDVIAVGDALWLGGLGASILAGAEGDFALAKLTRDGALDASFSGDGRVLTDWTVDASIDVLLPADDDVIALGAIDNGGGNLDIAGARYRPDGSVVDGWGTEGTGIVLGHGGQEYAPVATMVPGGIAVAAGSNFQVVRFNQDTGDVDTSWGADGWSDAVDGVAQAMLHWREGLMQLGVYNNGEAGLLRLVALQADGHLDTTFGAGGVADVVIPLDVLDLGSESVPSSVIRVRGAAATPDGGWIVYVQALALTGQAPALLKVRADGTLDTAWEQGGAYVLPGAFAIFEGATYQSEELVVVFEGEAIVVDTWLRDAPGGGIDSFLAMERVGL